MIERDRLILSEIKHIAKVSMQAKYRVIGVYDKSYIQQVVHGKGE